MRTKIRRKRTKAGVRWYVSVVDEHGHEDAHGGYQTQKAAKAAAAALVTDAARGRYVAPETLTVSGYLLGEWLPTREIADISRGTRDTECTMVASWILPYIGDTPLQKLAARDLDALYATLRASGARGGRPLAGKSVRNVHALLSKALGDAVRRGHLVVSPVMRVDVPARDDSIERIAWTLEEARAFLSVAAGDRLHAVWRLLLATGARRGELLGLTWDDVSDHGATVQRQVLVGSGAGRVYVRSTTKTRRVRRVRFDDATATALASWKAAQGRERLAFGPAYKSAGGLGIEAPWLVTEPDGVVVHPDTLGRRFAAIVKMAGVTPITLHSARHTYAELALAAGVRLDVVSRQLGHASIGTTANIYTHDNDTAATDAAERLGKALG
jgi:integrase